MKKGINWRKITAAISVLGLFASLAACNNASFTANKQSQRSQGDGGFSNPNGIPTDSTVPGVINCNVDISNVSNCFTGANVDGVNVWVVVDASSSFTMREQVGRQLAENFENGLKNNLPLTISVIAAHTLNSPFGSNGNNIFYQHNNEPHVIQVNQSSDFHRASQDLRTKFSFDMKADPKAANYYGGPDNNKHTGANEMGLLSLTNAMTRIPSGNITRQSKYGWLVIFAADENDPCVQDPGVSTPRGEQAMYDNDCRNGVDGRRITPGLVFSEMRRFAGLRSMMVSGILNANGRVVLGDPRNSGIGYGYLEVIQQAQGQVSPLPF